MFCPSCGKENQETGRFCRACGRSLAGIPLLNQEDSGTPLERVERRLDEIIAHHAGRYFKRTPAGITPRSLKESWKLLGMGYLAVAADLFYTWLIVQFVLQFRLWILVFESPWKWWREHRVRKAGQDAPRPDVPGLQKPTTGVVPVGSITEEPTEPLARSTETMRRRTTGPR
ncbi:MAG: zinc ribbon domain-containing protein [Acidobacteria bacterium]|nr:zinc ribbon domain-containing protein [Acidobacteriota bacterium]